MKGREAREARRVKGGEGRSERAEGGIQKEKKMKERKENHEGIAEERGRQEVKEGKARKKGWRERQGHKFMTDQDRPSTSKVAGGDPTLQHCSRRPADEAARLRRPQEGISWCRCREERDQGRDGWREEGRKEGTEGRRVAA